MHKYCHQCRTWKDKSEFYKHPMTKDRLSMECKECVRGNSKKRYHIMHEDMCEYDRRRARNPIRMERKISYQHSYRNRNLQKYKARNAVSNAIRDGKIIKKPCEICGDVAQAHHSDYSKPLDVNWLCFKCHREVEHHQKTSFQGEISNGR